jgi:hypothetical protein
MIAVVVGDITDHHVTACDESERNENTNDSEDFDVAVHVAFPGPVGCQYDDAQHFAGRL